MPRVKVAYDNLPPDAEVDVPYLGKFKNGTTTKVEQWQWDRYKQFHPGAEEVGDSDMLELSTAASEARSTAIGAATRAAYATRLEVDIRPPEHQPAVVREGEAPVETEALSQEEMLSENQRESLEDRDKDELVEMAVALGVDRAKQMKKAELVKAIEEYGTRQVEPGQSQQES